MFGKTQITANKFATSTQGIEAGQLVHLEGCDFEQSAKVVSVSSTSITVVVDLDSTITLELNAKGIFSQINTSSIFPFRLLK